MHDMTLNQLEQISELNLSAYLNIRKNIEKTLRMAYVQDSEKASTAGDYADYDIFKIAASGAFGFADYLRMDKSKNATAHFFMVHCSQRYAVAIAVDPRGFVVDRRHLFQPETINDVVSVFMPHFVVWDRPIWDIQMHLTVAATAEGGETA